MERKPRSREKERRPRKRRDESLNNLENEEEETISVKGKHTLLVSPKESTKQAEAMMTFDTSSKYSIVDEAESRRRGFTIEKLSKYESPNLKNPDGSKFNIIGKAQT